MAQQKAVEAPEDGMDDVVDELAPGTKLLRGQYTIVRYLNSGGFGITYLAKDSLDRNVVIKECFPSSFCRRSKTVVAARSRAHTAELRSVVQLFVREARNLAKIVHPNIVAVHQVFEDNFTAYMAIDFIDGLDLQEVIEGKGKLPTAKEIVVITEKLLAAVGFIHSSDMLHRDISPDNVLIDKTGEPILIDFGAARDEASQKNRAMSALRVVKDGYSPQEFYIAGSEQGPWSDLYALGATLFHLISGEAPTNGQARLAALAEGRPDPYNALEGRFAGYPPGFLASIDKAMQTLPAKRVQSAAQWLAMFKSPDARPQGTGESVQSAVRAMVVDSIANGSALQAAAPRGAPAQEVMPVVAREPDAELYVDDDPSHDAEPDQRDLAPAHMFGNPPDFVGLTAGKATTLPPKKGGNLQVVLGVAFALAVVGGVYLMMGGEEAADVADVTEVTSAVADVAETAPAAVEVASADPAPAAVETATTPEPIVEPEPEAEPEVTATETAIVATPEPVAEPEPAVEAVAAVELEAVSTLAPPVGKILANQVGFAAWDAEIPFMEENRIIGGEKVAIVSRLLPTTDIAISGNWLAPGLLLFAVNGTDVQQSGTFTTSVLNAAKVDPDGKARVVVEYAGSSLERQTGLLTVDMTRLVSLANGVNLEVGVTPEGTWQALVSGITRPEVTELRQGDVLFRDKTTGTALDGPDSLETVMAALVEAGIGVTQFSVIRDNKVITAGMQLAVETTP